MKRRQLLPLLLAALALPGWNRTVQAIDLGDPAPALTIAEWVKGKPVDLKKGGEDHVYVVEFWATWCPPCRASIPHLSEVQAEFKDKKVTIIGISDETPAKVNPFVTNMGDKMAYTVALDDDRATYKSYMEAFGVNGIPHAFIVNQKGQIAWHGHPMAGLDTALKQIVAGTFDIAAAQRAAKAEQLLQEYFAIVAAGKSTPEAAKMGADIVRDGATNPELLNQFSWLILTHPAVKDRDLDLALKAGKAAYDASQGKDPAIIDTYARALFDTGKPGEAIRLQQEAIALCKDPDMKAALEDTLDRYRLEAEKK